MTDEQLIENLRARMWACDCEAAAFRIEELLARVAELEAASKIRPEFDHLYADTPGLFSLVSEEEFRQSMGVSLRDCHSSRIKNHDPDPPVTAQAEGYVTALRYIAWEADGYMDCVHAAKRAIGEMGALPPPPKIQPTEAED